MPTTTRTRYIPIEVDPHVAQFFKARVGEILKLNHRNKLGNIVWPRIKPQPKYWRPAKPDPKKSYVVVRITHTSYKQLHLDEEACKWLGRILKDIFHDFYHTEVDQQRIDFGLTASEAIRLFLARYGFSEDIFCFDTAYKNYQRYKSERKINSIR